MRLKTILEEATKNSSTFGDLKIGAKFKIPNDVNKTRAYIKMSNDKAYFYNPSVGATSKDRTNTFHFNRHDSVISLEELRVKVTTDGSTSKKPEPSTPKKPKKPTVKVIHK